MIHSKVISRMDTWKVKESFILMIGEVIRATSKWGNFMEREFMNTIMVILWI